MYSGKCRTFFSRAGFSVGYVPQSDRAIRHPRVNIDDTVAFYSVKLAKLGYYGGNPELIRQAPLTMVMDIINYENFASDLQAAYRGLNDVAGR